MTHSDAIKRIREIIEERPLLEEHSTFVAFGQIIAVLEMTAK